MQTDLVVVGAGLVGLATAYQAQRANPGLHVVVVDKEAVVGLHQSSHNSGVLHAGVYYAPGSLKAQLCLAGKRQMEEFARDHGIPVVRNGKLVVAVKESELPALARIFESARANGVPDLVELDAVGLRQVEPAVSGVRAVYSPQTAVVDFGAVAHALADEVRAAGGEVRLGTQVHAIAATPTEVRITTSTTDLQADRLVTCAGLQADRLAAMTGDDAGIRTVPFRGRWYQLSERAASLCRGHVYPVPDSRLPFLGVHVSRRIDGQVWAGPNAVLAGGREAYDGGINLRDLRSTLGYPGFWRLARRYAVSGAREMAEDHLRRAYLRRIREYLPDVVLADLGQRRAGIRAQAVDRDGKLVDDFVVRTGPRVAHVLNAPSPAATSSLAIGSYLVGELGFGR